MTTAIPAASSPASGCRLLAPLPRIGDLGKEMDKELTAGSRHG